MTQSVETDLIAEDNFDSEFDGVDTETDQRRYDRHEISTDGFLKFSNGFKVAVKVLDMSRSGARLRLKQFVVLPNEFEVEIFSPDRRKLKITTSSRQWQRQDECGVKFLTSRTELMPEGAY